MYNSEAVGKILKSQFLGKRKEEEDEEEGREEKNNNSCHYVSRVN
jgi:hypothetical protein